MYADLDIEYLTAAVSRLGTLHTQSSNRQILLATEHTLTCTIPETDA